MYYDLHKILNSGTTEISLIKHNNVKWISMAKIINGHCPLCELCGIFYISTVL